MGLFNTLMTKIFGHAQAASPPPATEGTQAGAGASSTTGGALGAAGAQTTSASVGSGAGAAPAQPVDVAATLNALAAKNHEKLDWKHSIVDLMKLVGMDSSLSARKELATDLQYTGDQSDSATMNMWLHKEVLKKLAENGGKVPQELLSK